MHPPATPLASKASISPLLPKVYSQRQLDNNPLPESVGQKRWLEVPVRAATQARASGDHLPATAPQGVAKRVSVVRFG